MNDRSTRYLYAHALVKTVMYGTAGGTDRIVDDIRGCHLLQDEVPLLCVPMALRCAPLYSKL